MHFFVTLDYVSRFLFKSFTCKTSSNISSTPCVESREGRRSSRTKGIHNRTKLNLSRTLSFASYKLMLCLDTAAGIVVEPRQRRRCQVILFICRWLLRMSHQLHVTTASCQPLLVCFQGGSYFDELPRSDCPMQLPHASRSRAQSATLSWLDTESVLTSS